MSFVISDWIWHETWTKKSSSWRLWASFIIPRFVFVHKRYTFVSSHSDSIDWLILLQAPWSLNHDLGDIDIFWKLNIVTLKYFFSSCCFNVFMPHEFSLFSGFHRPLGVEPPPGHHFKYLPQQHQYHHHSPQYHHQTSQFYPRSSPPSYRYLVMNPSLYRYSKLDNSYYLPNDYYGYF